MYIFSARPSIDSLVSFLAGARRIAVNNNGVPSPGFSQAFMLKGDKVICFDTDSQVFIPNDLSQSSFDGRRRLLAGESRTPSKEGRRNIGRDNFSGDIPRRGDLEPKFMEENVS
jgi:hypothetical protein